MTDSRTSVHGVGVYETKDAAGNTIEGPREVEFRILSPAKMDNGRTMVFSMPSAVALSLSLAVSAAKGANQFRSEIKHERSTDPTLGKIENVGPDSAVYDCIQQSMLCVTFSYQALETFCNERMSLFPDTIVEVSPGRGRPKEKRAASACDWVTTESKLNEVLPALLGKPPIKGTKVWSLFSRLQKERNAVVHMNSAVSRPRNLGIGKVPKATVFHKFVATPDTKWMPRVAIDVLEHFGVTDDWFVTERARLNLEEKAIPEDVGETPNQRASRCTQSLVR